MEAVGDTIFEEMEEQESNDPSLPMMSDGVPIDRTRTPVLQLSGNPILSDFGQMRPREPINKEDWMSDLYRAPEVLIGLPWDYQVDNWCLGVMVSRMVQDIEIHRLTDVRVRRLSFLKGRTCLIPWTVSITSMFSRWHWHSTLATSAHHHWT